MWHLADSVSRIRPLAVGAAILWMIPLLAEGSPLRQVSWEDLPMVVGKTVQIALPGARSSREWGRRRIGRAGGRCHEDQRSEDLPERRAACAPRGAAHAQNPIQQPDMGGGNGARLDGHGAAWRRHGIGCRLWRRQVGRPLAVAPGRDPAVDPTPFRERLDRLVRNGG